MNPHTWKVLSRTTVYDGSPWLRVHQDDLRLPDGSILHAHHVVDIPRPAVGVVPVGSDGRILLIEHHRFITQTTAWEIPAGGFDPNEDVFTAGKRELLEETGHAADHLQHLGHYHPVNGLSNLAFNVCIATGVHRVTEIQDTNEVIRIDWFTPTQITDLLKTNKIKDGLSVTSLLWYLLLHPEK